MARIAITDGMAEDAVLMLKEAGHEVDLLSSNSPLDGYDAAVIRSATKITSQIIASAPSLSNLKDLFNISDSVKYFP